MKIATFNINNINKRLDNLKTWLAKAQPDVVCLQELKVAQQPFPANALREIGCRGVWLGERSWNGVAILAREYDPVLTRSSLPGNPEDRQARYIEAAVNGVLITSIYLPNGNPQPGPKFNYKLAWFLDRARRSTHSGRGACRLGRRLQCCAGCARHLSNAVFRQQRIDSTSEPSGVCSIVNPGLDGRSAKTAT
jgi:exodeoxyribonuclease III